MQLLTMGMFLNFSHWEEVFDKETLCHLIYLFILVLELLSAAIKNDPEITGVNLKDSEFLLSQYADDSSLILDDNPKSLEQSLFMLNKFSECAGLRVNLDKTEAIWLGSKRSCDEQLLPDTDLPTDPPPIMTRGGSSFSPAKLPTKN